MSIIYNIYSNDGAGGPVDDSSPVASTADLTYVTGPLQPSSDTTFLVRALDTATGFEEANTQALVRIVLDSAGEDVSGLPNPPHALALAPVAGGGCRASWAYVPAVPYGVPTGFDVYLTAGGTVDYSTPATTVPFSPGVVGYSCVLPGPYAVSTYVVAVRSFNSVGTEGNLAFATASLGLSAVAYVLDPVNVQFV